MCRLRIQELKIRKLVGFEKIDFFSFFLLRKRLSSGQKCFLMPYFPLIRGMSVFRSGLRFSFWALEVPEPRVRKRSFSVTATSGGQGKQSQAPASTSSLWVPSICNRNLKRLCFNGLRLCFYWSPSDYCLALSLTWNDFETWMMWLWLLNLPVQYWMTTLVLILLPMLQTL